MRILCVNIPPAAEGSELARYTSQVYSPAVQRNIDLFLPESEVVFRTCEWGLPMLEGAPLYRHLDMLASRTPFYSAAAAQEEGFDGVLLDCFGDPMLQELRQHIDIPVVGLCESSLLMAGMMGRNFGVVTVGETNLIGVEEDLRKYGQLDRCVGVETLPPGAEAALGPALTDARPLLEGFVPAARRLAARGAEVILPGCSMMSLAARFAPGAEREYPHGLTQVDGAVVADIIGCAVSLLRSLADLKRAGSPWISRKLKYRMPKPEEKELFRSVSEDKNLKFWDHTVPR